MVRIAMTDMMLNDDGHTNIRNQDALLSFDNYPDITALRQDHEKDKAKIDPAVFDVVLTNPPFGSIMRQETMEMLGRFDLGHKKKSLPLEVLGLERSIQFLKPGGRLAIVLPEHMMKGKSAAFVRKWLYGVAHIKAIFFFPEEAKKLGELALAGRWDIDFHLPPIEIKKFPKNAVVRVDEVADISKGKRDPGKNPDTVFQYVDIASVDVTIGVVSNPQELRGDEAPSRARKVIRAFDVIVSTCRPTRGAIAVIPEALHNQIASTAFSIVRAKEGINPFYLHYALRLPSTLEQFRKWSTGSSYPAILDEDVKKTLIPVPDPAVQDQIAQKVLAALHEREIAIAAANADWNGALDNITATLCGEVQLSHAVPPGETTICTIADVNSKLAELPPLDVEGGTTNGDAGDLFEEATDE